MAETAAEILARMREAKKVAAPSQVNPEDFYVKLRIAPFRRRQLAVLLTLAFFIMISLINNDTHRDRPWTLTLLPLLFVGLLVTLIPPSEEWIYKPWQAKPRQYERHQIERR